MAPKISVIVPAINEEKYIMNLFQGLSDQTFKDFEVIVVDGGSKDRTVEIAKKNNAKVIMEKKKGIGIARNTGAAKSRGSILVFLDADTKPSRNLLKTYNEVFEKDEDIVAATGPIYPLEKTNKRILLGYKIVSIFFVKLSIMLGVPSVVGSNFSARRSPFMKIHGFNPKLLTYEDWDLSIRIRNLGRIVYDNNASVQTSVRRVAAWGIFGYFRYHFGNMLRYYFLKKTKEDYGEIR